MANWNADNIEILQESYSNFFTEKDCILENTPHSSGLNGCHFVRFLFCHEIQVTHHGLTTMFSMVL